eukprot:NODE_1546_length_1115_cov_231.798113.p1 GENE.NODE_1546_length_1115_cov_231.798113~~NODE_1546_length_1115_cov_231.798113.p1  ORF type:complete len:261 (+),score=44.60 NODE_1546_length_1115_cov_231.798113:3-785(+)
MGVRVRADCSAGASGSTGEAALSGRSAFGDWVAHAFESLSLFGCCSAKKPMVLSDMPVTLPLRSPRGSLGGEVGYSPQPAAFEDPFVTAADHRPLSETASAASTARDADHGSFSDASTVATASPHPPSQPLSQRRRHPDVPALNLGRVMPSEHLPYKVPRSDRNPFKASVCSPSALRPTEADSAFQAAHDLHLHLWDREELARVMQGCIVELGDGSPLPEAAPLAARSTPSPRGSPPPRSRAPLQSELPGNTNAEDSFSV